MDTSSRLLSLALILTAIGADRHLVVIAEADGAARVSKVSPTSGEVEWTQDVK